jgi:CRP-like cAMP-binding protein
MTTVFSPCNRFLGRLEPADFELLMPHIKPVELTQGMVLVKAGAIIERVYLPHSGIISVVVPLSDQNQVEVAMIGRDSLIGALAGPCPP